MPKKVFDVICVGSASIDCFVKLPVDFKDIKHGSKILIDDIELLTGGGGTNVAAGLAKLGMRTGFIGEVGEDLSAEMISHDLKKRGITFLVKQHSRHATAYSVVLEKEGSDRAILVYKGASSYLEPYEIPKSIDARWFYFASVTGKSFKTMEYLAGFARKNKIAVYFNPSSYMTEKGYGFMKKVIAGTKIIAMNKEEAEKLLGVKTGNRDVLLKGLRKLGPEICIITDGENGVHAYDGKKMYFTKAHRIRPVDTTGAGDAFGAGFLAGFIMKQSLPLEDRIKFAIELGLKDAESVIMKVGAKAGLLSKREAFRLVK